MRLLSRELGNYAVFSAITGDMAGISSVIVESAISLNELVYSRTYEKEADLNGLDMLIERDIEPEAMLRLFERILEENKELEEFLKDLELLSTHPLTDNRMDYIKDYIESKGLIGYLGKKNEKAEMLWKKIKEK
jgi:predicted Zn-dependent protease